MKTKTASSPLSGERFYARTFVLVALAALAVLLFTILKPFLTPLIWSLFIAFLLLPTQRWLSAKLGRRNNVSAVLLTLATVIVIVGPLTALGAAFGAQAADLVQYLRGVAEKKDFADITQVPMVGAAFEWAQHTLGISFAKMLQLLEAGARNVLQPLAEMGRKVVFGTIGAVISFVITMFLLFFMIRDWEDKKNTLYVLIPLSTEHRDRLFHHLGSVTRAVIFGTLVTATVQGILVGLGFYAVGLPSPIVFGVLAALSALIPMAGTPFVWIPGVIALALQQRWVAAGVLLGWGVFVTTIDNLLRPWLASGRAQVSTLTVFIGVLGGVSAFGAVGLLLGPFILALATALIRFTLEVRAQESAEENEKVPPVQLLRTKI